MGHGDMNLCDHQNCAAQGDARQDLASSRRTARLVALTIILLGVFVLSGSMTGLAKDKQPTTRTISGTVYDEAQNTIEGATIELTDVQTGKVLDIYSRDAGQYQYTDLRFDHDYTVKAIYKGLSSEVRHISIFETRWTLVLNLTIPTPKK